MKKMHLRHIPVLVLMAVGLVGAVARTPKTNYQDPDRMKAAYLFLEASNRIQEGNFGTAYHMLSRAAALDPSDPAISGALADLLIFSESADSAEFAQGYAAIKKRYLADKTDVQNALRLIRVANAAHRDDDVRDTYRMLMEQYPGRSEFAMEYAIARAFDYMKGDTAAASEALGIIDRIEKAIGPDPNITINRLQVYAIKRDTAAMISEIERYGASAPADVQVNFLTGQFFEHINRPDSALHYYERACAIDSTYGPAYLARAEHYLASGDSARYQEEVNVALGSPSLEFPSKLEILTNYTRAVYQHPERQASLDSLFVRMLDINPGEDRLHNLYGAFLAAMDSNARAAEQFSYAMDLSPENQDYPRFRLQTALEANDTVQAIATARAASARFHNLYFPFMGSVLLSLQKDYEGALAMLDSFKIDGTEQPKAVSSYYQQRGDIMHNLNHTDSALVDYEHAIRFDPENVGALNNMAYFMALEGKDIDKAEGYIRRAMSAEPLNPTYIDTYAWVLFKKKDYEGARREIDEALRVYAEPADTLIADTPDAPVDSVAEEIVNIEEEIGIGSPSAEIYDHAGDIYYMCGLKDEALEFWKQAAALEPENKKIAKKIKTRRIDVTQP